MSVILFSTERYAGMARALTELIPMAETGQIERTRFPDGEHYRRLRSNVQGKDVVLLGGTVDEQDTLEMYDLACTLVGEGAHILTLAIPWFGYQTMERAVYPGEVVTAKTRARLLSSIPIAGSGNRAVLVDLHSEGIAQYFEGSIRPVHLYAKPIVLDLIRELGGENFVVAATDAGRAKWVESLANDLGVDAGFVFKRRLSGDATEVTALAADVEGKTVVIYDDMIRTGGSLIGAAKAFLGAGAKDIAAVTTHGVFPGNALDRLQESGLFKQIGCTDSHPRAAELLHEKPSRADFLKIVSIAKLLAPAVLNAARPHLPPNA